MKKLVCLMLAAVLALCIAAVPAAAAELPTPWTDDSLTVWVLDDFTGEDTEIIGLNTEKSEGNKWVQYASSNPDLSVQFIDNSLRFYYLSAGVENIQLLTNDSAAKEGANLDGVLGIGMYLENNTENAVSIIGHMYAGGFFESLIISPYYIVENGQVTENMVPETGYVDIPVGFKGYVMFPLSYFGDVWDGGSVATYEDAYDYMVDRVCLVLNALGEPDQTDSYLLIDDIFFYGEGVTDNTAEKGDIELSARQPGSEQPGTGDENTATPAPDADPTSEATDPETTSEVTASANDSTQPAQEATPSASDDNTSDDEVGFPWVIVIIVAVVVIAIIIIAVAALKKKKNSNN